MSKLTALVFRSVVVASLFGSAVACTAEIQVPEGLGSKVSDALGTKKGHDGGTSSSDASVDEPDASGDAGSVVILGDAGSWGSDGGVDESGDSGTYGDDDDDSSSDAGVSWGSDASAW